MNSTTYLVCPRNTQLAVGALAGAEPECFHLGSCAANTLDKLNKEKGTK